MRDEPVSEVRTVAGRLLVHGRDRVIAPVLHRDGVWELAETRFLLATLLPGQTFVDVGAHVGYFSVLAARRVGPAGAVIAVEPEPRNLRLLRQNLARNGCTNATVLAVAAAAAPGRMSLALDEENRGGHRLVPLNEAELGVECVRLDDVLPAKVDLVKIDAQGYDHEVVAGLERTLRASPHAIVIAELSLTELARRRIDPESVVDGYRRRGFTISTCDPRGGLRRASGAAVVDAARAGRSTSEIALVLHRPQGGGERPARRPGLELEDAPDGLVVVDPEHGRAHRLNETASLVLELCTGERTVEQIAEGVRQAYRLPGPPRREVEECVAHLRSEGLVR